MAQKGRAKMSVMDSLEIKKYLKQELAETKITRQKINFVDEKYKYQELEILIDDYQLKIKQLKGEFLKIEAAKEAKHQLSMLRNVLQKSIGTPNLSYDLFHAIKDENVAAVEWCGNNPQKRLVKILNEEVYEKGYHCYNIRVIENHKYTNKYDIHPRTALDLGLGGEDTNHKVKILQKQL